jgi:hypothetical protein
MRESVIYRCSGRRLAGNAEWRIDIGEFPTGHLNSIEGIRGSEVAVGTATRFEQDAGAAHNMSDIGPARGIFE